MYRLARRHYDNSISGHKQQVFASLNWPKMIAMEKRLRIFTVLQAHANAFGLKKLPRNGSTSKARLTYEIQAAVNLVFLQDTETILQTSDEHIYQVQQALTLLHKRRPDSNPEQCELFTNFIDFSGHVIH